jgi:hypothetical protein
MSRWTVIHQGEGKTDVMVDDPQWGRTHVGTLYLNERDVAELEARLAVEYRPNTHTDL